MRRSLTWPFLIVVNLVLMLLAHQCLADDETAPLRVAADRPVDVQHIRLELDVDLKNRGVSGTATLDVRPLRGLRTLTLNAVGHEIGEIRGEDRSIGKPLTQLLEHTYDGERLTIEFPEPIRRGDAWRIAIDYQVRQPEDGLHFFAPTGAEPKTPRTVWSQGEPISNRHWFPCVDNPNERQTSEMLVTVPAGYEALSNGRLVSKEETEDGRVRFHWTQDRPHVAYLVTLVVGEYTVGRDEWRGKPVLYYVEPHRADDLRATFGRTEEMLEFFSERFGIEYPWEKYAQVVVEQFIIGGMENTSATTLYQGVMHDERARIDSTPDRLIAHELGHQWWGDLVTCKDWSHIWLNEGFATYCEVLWWEHKLGRDERDYLLYQKSKSARSGSALKRPVVDRRYERPWDMFDTRAYPKGGWVLHMLRSRLGDDDFFGSVQRYGTVYAYESVETADLRKIFERMTGYSLERFFYDWTERPGHPVLKVKTAYQPDDKLVRIDVAQTQDGEAFHFPLEIALHYGDAEGEDAETLASNPRTLRLDITEKERTVYLPLPSEPTLVRVDPEYTLLVDLQEEKSRDLWEAQALRAPTVPERIRAVEHFGEGKRPADVDLLVQVLQDDPFWGVRAEAAKALGKAGTDDARDALTAALEADGADGAKVRRAAAEALGEFVGDAEVVAALERKWNAGDASYFVEAAVLEALSKADRRPKLPPFLAGLERDSHTEVIREAALRGLGRTHEPAALDMLLEWTRRGRPRDARVAALAGVADFLRHNDVTPARTERAIERLVASLDTAETPKVRQAAVEALRDLGRGARPALAAVEALAEHDPNGRVRTAAERAAEAIRTEAAPADELTRLRKQVDELQEENEDLGDRLIKLEASK